MNVDIEFLKKIALEAGTYIKRKRPLASEIESKEGRGNFVTAHDKAVQAMLYDALRKEYPECGFLGEEDEVHSESLPEYCFIIDPIDGTANFINGYSHSAVSIAYVEHGAQKAGVVYDPYLNELFYAEAGEGAFLNGSPIRVSGRSLRDSIVLFGISPYYEGYGERSFGILRKLYENACDVRNSGSAALDVCYVASGKADIFFELKLSPWDYAAAGLILNEAGGAIKNCEGGEISLVKGGSVLCASEEMMEIIAPLVAKI